MKMLVRANPQALVSLLLPGAKFQGEQDKELKARTVEADLLYNVIWRGRKIILHVEFQVEADKNMARRVWEYNVLTDYLTGLPVYSVVIYLVKRGTIVESRYQDEIADQLRLLTFRSIELWEVPTEMLKQKGLEGLLPLLPLTQGGKSRKVVEETIAQLQATGHRDLLPLSYASKKGLRKCTIYLKVPGLTRKWYRKVYYKGCNRAVKRFVSKLLLQSSKLLS